MTTRPRIVHVYKDMYPPVEGGIERTIHHLARLTASDFEVEVIVASRSGRGSRRLIEPGIAVTEVPCHARALSTPLAPGFIPALRASRADLFHFHMPNPAGETALLLSGLKTPSVTTYHSDVVRQRAALVLYRPFMNRFLARQRVIMPTSRRYMESSEQLRPHLDRCRPVPLGLPIEDYKLTAELEPRRDRFRSQYGDFIFFIGVLRYYKGLRYLIEAMRRIPNARLVIAGEGPLRAGLEALAAPLGDRVVFAGRVGHADAVALFHAASVFCLPACERSEAFGLCQVEALACGLPIVSTDLPTAVPEVNLHGETGLVVPPKDPAALAGAITTLLADETLRMQYAGSALRRARTCYTARVMADTVAGIYREILQ